MRRLLVIVMAAALVAAGCGNDDGDDVLDDVTPTTEAPDDVGDDADGADGGTTTADATVAVAETDLGEVLVDGDGFTLYLFTNDSEGSSACTGGCASTWPPLTVDGEPSAGDGVDASLLGTITRDDGSTQVAYNGHPLYTYAPDEAPGDTTGQGVGGVWFALTPAGDAVE